ncbi:hypothetical protein GOFOIKOB_6343 [Methylobacterium tardum]|uniref:Uncharacterized protein n=2 Tax=Methylobacterium tardum TaxID=374432 RepID=A0AA37WPA0_9HYPH|nr:hypothetical protein GOFOIKOB_6343 [Methylobacterium tardum]GLS67991.1 hypothetical protein GCM10007890_00020 [Methylobacterium tardum]
MFEIRTDLDGLRLVEPGKPDVWLMFHGRRHRVASPAVYDALFAEAEALVHSDEITSIAMGPELNEGSCLIRAEHTTGIFLITGRYPKVVKHYIASYESFTDFGFSLAAVKDVPAILLDHVPLAPDLVSFRERRSQD